MIISCERTITWVITIDCSLLLLSQHVLSSWCLFFRLEALWVRNYFYCLRFFFLIVLNKLYVLNIINNKKIKLFMIITLYKHQLNSNISKIHLSCYVSAHLLGVMYHILLIWFKSPPSPEALPLYTRWGSGPSPLICSTQSPFLRTIF